MAPLPEVIQPAPGPTLGDASPARPKIAHAPAREATSEAPTPTRDTAGIADDLENASWNAYASTSTKSEPQPAPLSWEGPDLAIPRPAPTPRELDPRLLTTLPPPAHGVPPSWWRVAAVASAAVLLAAFGMLSLLPTRSATRLTSHLAGLKLELPAPPDSAPDDAEPLAEKVEAPAEDDAEPAHAKDAEKDADEKVAPVVVARPKTQVATPPRSWTPRARRPSGGFLAAIHERKRTMGYIVVRSAQPCVFYVDGTPHGAGRVLKVPAHPGAHRVTCRNENGRQSQSVEVQSRRVAAAVFRP